MKIRKKSSFTAGTDYSRQKDQKTGAFSVLPRFFEKMSYAKHISFKDYREENKISETAAFMLVFKSCVGLGVFTYPFAFANAGYIFGTIMCVLLTYMTGYGMYCLSSLASKVEKSKFGLVKMHNYYGNFPRDFLTLVLGRHLMDKCYPKKSLGRAIEAMAIIGCFMINFSVVVGGIIESSILFSPLTGLPKFVVKLLVMGIFAVVTGFVLEPERLKPIGGVCAATYICIRELLG